MSFINISANMNLPIPIALVDPGPDWALNINSSLTIIDGHNHSAGSGVAITPAGLNINADLPFNNNNATSLRSSRYFAQPAALSLATDIGCVYVAGVDLYFNDVDGNQIRLTQSGSIVGTAGSISGLPSGTASASYEATPKTFVFQSATNTPANIDGASYILRNLTANSHGLTLNPPSAMGADYSLVLPTIPAQTNILTIDTSGNIGSALNVDNVTLDVSGNSLEIKAGGVGTAQLANGAVTNAKLAALNSVISSSCGAFTSTGTSHTPVTNLTATITSVGRPIFIGLMPDGTTNVSFFGVSNTTNPMAIAGMYEIYRASTLIATGSLSSGSSFFGTGTVVQTSIPLSSISTIDSPSASTYTYTVVVYADSVGSTVAVNYAKLIVYEL